MLSSKTTLSALMCGTLLAHISYADHLPSRLLARGKPEKVLSGIHLERTKLRNIEKMYGRPVRVDGDEYFWNKSGLRIHVIIYRGPAIRNGEYIALIEVEGRSSGHTSIGRTGAGLRLGDTKATLKRLYGPRFRETRRENALHQINVEWRTEEISLLAELDDHGRIKKLGLLAPE